MFKYVFLPTDVSIEIPSEFTEFKCLILIERKIDAGYREKVSNALVKAGCLYALAWGLDCSTWDDSIDWAFLEHYDFGKYPEKKFVMTTWHEDETLEEVVDFARYCAEHSDVRLDDILVLDFNGQERGSFIEKLYMEA